jgi:hypothetical protein
LNPRQWRTHEFSSLKYYLQQSKENWIRPERILNRFSSRQDYLYFIEDTIGHKQMLDILKLELANDF